MNFNEKINKHYLQLNESIKTPDNCPICGEKYCAQCRCPSFIPVTIESLKNGHGLRCKNDHRWSGNLVYDPTNITEAKNVEDQNVKTDEIGDVEEDKKDKIKIKNIFKGDDEEESESEVQPDVTPETDETPSSVLSFDKPEDFSSILSGDFSKLSSIKEVDKNKTISKKKLEKQEQEETPIDKPTSVEPITPEPPSNEEETISDNPKFIVAHIDNKQLIGIFASKASTPIKAYEEAFNHFRMKQQFYSIDDFTKSDTYKPYLIMYQKGDKKFYIMTQNIDVIKAQES